MQEIQNIKQLIRNILKTNSHQHFPGKLLDTLELYYFLSIFDKKKNYTDVHCLLNSFM